MCLIIYAPHATEVNRLDFMSAAVDNPDGIGFMSADGIVKFTGRKRNRRAYHYMRDLARRGIPYGLHFRWATHGKICEALTHPFAVPETGDFVMHNGIIGVTAKYASKTESDTSIYANEWLPYYSSRKTDPDEWLREVSADTYGSKLLFMSEDGSDFALVHESQGDWCRGLWYSNAYSLKSDETKAIQWGGGWSYATTTKDAPSHAVAKVDPVDYQTAIKRLLERDTTRKGARRFDWHDTSTWDLYPSRRSRHAPLNRFDDGDYNDALIANDRATWNLGDPDPLADDDNEIDFSQPVDYADASDCELMEYDPRIGDLMRGDDSADME